MDRTIERDFRRFRTKGDSKALGRVFDAAAPELARLSHYLVKDASAAEDVLQATFVTAIEKASSYEEGRGLMAWLTGILARHAAQSRRLSARSPDPERLPRPTPADPATTAETGELAQLALEQLDALPPTYGPAVRSFLTDGKPAREIGASLGISAGAASVRLHRGLNMLRERLRRDFPQTAVPTIAALPLASIREALVATATTNTPVAGTTAAKAAVAGGTLMTKKTVALVAAGVLLGVGTREAAVALQHPPESHALENAVELGSVTRPDPSPSHDEDSQGLAEATQAPSARRPLTDPGQELDESRLDWLTRLNRADSQEAAKRVLGLLATMPDGNGGKILTRLWPRIEPEAPRMWAPNVFTEHADEGLVAVLAASVADEDARVQHMGLLSAGYIAHQELQGRPEEFRSWLEAVNGLDLEGVVRTSARRFVEHGLTLSDEHLLAALDRLTFRSEELIRELDLDPSEVWLTAGFDKLVQRLLDSGLAGSERMVKRLAKRMDLSSVVFADALGLLQSPELSERVTGLDLLRSGKISKELLDGHVLPIVRDHSNRDPEELQAALNVLAGVDLKWDPAPVLSLIQEPAHYETTNMMFAAGMALGNLEDPRAIPTMIGVIMAHNDYETVYGLGYFGLRKMTDVPYDESHDGDFWLDWWDKNRGRFGDGVSSIPIPTVGR